MKTDVFVQKVANATAQLVMKADNDDDTGTFEAIVSVFGVKDLQGDVVEPGAFSKTLKGFGKEKALPAVWSHQFHNPDMFLGKYLEAEENDNHLRLVGKLNMDYPMGQRVHSLMKDGLVRQFSWSGRVQDFDPIEKGDDLYDEENEWMNGARIKEIDLWEAGPTFRGANSETALLGVKTASGLSVMRKAETQTPEAANVLRDIREKLSDAIALADSAKTDNGESDSGSAPNTDAKVRKSAVLNPAQRALLALYSIDDR